MCAERARSLTTSGDRNETCLQSRHAMSWMVKPSGKRKCTAPEQSMAGCILPRFNSASRGAPGSGS